ncbi:MAG: hypothetical protein C4575_07410 [Desulforudis sp.]|jgi:hypothetical protein|nr:MAG: hypothetical protein C4575_07410 [Desulforudis sp.]
MNKRKTYRVFVPEDELNKFENPGDKLFTETVIDEDTQEAFRAKIMVSTSLLEGYDSLLLQGRGGFLPGQWFVKIVERDEEDEDESVTVFESMRLGERRGYMLRSMMAETEERKKKKEEIMTTELEKRLQKKRQLIEQLLNKKT